MIQPAFTWGYPDFQNYSAAYRILKAWCYILYVNFVGQSNRYPNVRSKEADIHKQYSYKLKW